MEAPLEVDCARRAARVESGVKPPHSTFRLLCHNYGLMASSFAESGFAIFPGVFSRDEMTALADEIASARIPHSRAGARHLLVNPAVGEIAHSPQMLEIAKDILGDNATPFRATLFEKTGKSNWLVAWHQDTALPLRDRRDVPGWGPWSVKAGIHYAHAPASALERVVALRLHLDDSMTENGPLRVLPGTHTLGVLAEAEVLRCAASLPALECLVPRGGVVAMRPLIIHASSKSQTDAPRRVLHIEYCDRLELEPGLTLALA